MKEKAKEIITKGIETYPVYFNKKDAYATNGLNLMIGKIAFGTELGLFTIDEMDFFIDKVFNEFDKLESI